MLKRFLIFAGDAAQPSGGWDDFLADLSNLSDAVEFARENTANDLAPNWAHVVDQKTKEIVAAIRNGDDVVSN
ncbi:MAG: hypothetical protein K5863_00070 [Nitratireductor sp.]|uniref:hypothetical protein n=1 Tax=Nitratireductor sp. TaxID=1872084 RepID=UPI0026130BEF|nr:hypothetical protein [Nitratireductor sp.]MCV0348443.1 hypothetical protein [Nitratireductor sp.]